MINCDEILNNDLKFDILMKIQIHFLTWFCNISNADDVQDQTIIVMDQYSQFI